MIQLGVLEEDVAAAAQLVAQAQEGVRAARLPLKALEARVFQLRNRRRAALESYRITEAAARACGLSDFPITRLSLTRYALEAESATLAIREIVANAGLVCAAVDAAYEQLTEARERQAVAMLALVSVLTSAPQPKQVETGRRLAREMALCDESRRHEESEQHAERVWMTDDHFDPHYDAREIAQRRARPWV